MSLETQTPFADLFKGFSLGKAAGFLLLLVGILIGGWLIYLVTLFFNAPEQIALLGYLREVDFALEFFAYGQEFRFHAPALLTYGVPLLLLQIVIRLFSAFVTLGGNLMRGR